MPVFSIAAAEADFERLIERAENGEEIEVLSESGARIRIVALTPEERDRYSGEPID